MADRRLQCSVIVSHRSLHLPLSPPASCSHVVVPVTPANLECRVHTKSILVGLLVAPPSECTGSLASRPASPWAPWPCGHPAAAAALVPRGRHRLAPPALSPRPPVASQEAPRLIQTFVDTSVRLSLTSGSEITPPEQRCLSPLPPTPRTHLLLPLVQCLSSPSGT